MNIMKRCAHDDLMHTHGAHQHDARRMACRKERAKPLPVSSDWNNANQWLLRCYINTRISPHPKKLSKLGAPRRANQASLRLVRISLPPAVGFVSL
jgi:hypothetical protein